MGVAPLFAALLPSKLLIEGYVLRRWEFANREAVRVAIALVDRGRTELRSRTLPRRLRTVSALRA
jgi:hypothetical protein